MGDIVMIGNRTVSTDDAVTHARQYLQTPGEHWAYPAYDGYLRATAAGPLTEADLLAPILLNVRHLSLRTYYGLLAEVPRLQGLLDRLSPDLTLGQASDEDLDVIGQFFSGIDENRLHGASGTTLAKILHRKRPALIPLYDKQVGTCYQIGVDAPVPFVRGRRWDEFVPLFARAVQTDLIAGSAVWATIATLASDPPVTPLRALDIVAWHLARIHR
jgi:hypothetical protein